MNKSRRGVSLLEVLVSMFVLSIGLMGVAALLPVGGFHIAEAGKADRSATCGRAALRDIRIRRMLDRLQSATDDPSEIVEMWPWVEPGKPVLIDPLGSASNAFPYGHADVTFADGTSGASMARVTLRSAALTDARMIELGMSIDMPRSVADRIFTWGDDLVFERPENDDERPLQLYQYRNGDSGTDPTKAAIKHAKGNYSWMVMVSPENVASIIVFYKRDYDVPSLSDIGPDNPKPCERVAVAEFTGRVPTDCSLSMPQEPSAARLGIGISDYLSTRENAWIMLTNGEVFKWYRVTSVANELDNAARLVTLAGPDWMHDKLDLNGDGAENELQAVICSGVVGVYTRPNGE